MTVAGMMGSGKEKKVGMLGAGARTGTGTALSSRGILSPSKGIAQTPVHTGNALSPPS